MKGTAEFIKKFEYLVEDMENAAIDSAKEVAPSMEAYAKQNRKWNDRTGHARQGLVGSYVYEKKHFVSCRIYHKVDYGYWLEVIQGGRFAILEETRNMFASQFFDGIDARFKSKRAGQ